MNELINSVDLIIFDMDGVLVDTQAAENEALRQLADLMGVALSAEAATELFAGKKIQDCVDLMTEMSSQGPPPGCVEFVRAKCEELLGSGLDPLPGVPELLAVLESRMCVASNSPLDIVERRLRDSGIVHHFSGHLYSAYEVGSWKPSPGLFEFAANAFHTQVHNCLVIEDSLVGVDAGLAAGMQVLQFNADPTVGPHRAGVETFSDIRALPRLVELSNV